MFGGASSVLEAHGLRVMRGGQSVNPNSVTWSAATIHQYDFVQPPGPQNVLGVVKFRFPNKHNVYMHDTPERHLFGGALRTFSHGCMRVQNPVRFAEVLLTQDKGWSTDAVQGYARRGGEIKLTTPIPVHVTYFTTIVDDDGKVQQWPDIYALDGRLVSALGARQLRRDRRGHRIEFGRAERAGCAAEGPPQAESSAAVVEPLRGPVRQLDRCHPGTRAQRVSGSRGPVSISILRPGSRASRLPG